MAMRANKVQPVKTEAIGSLKDKINGSNDFIFAEYRGLTVEQISALRKQLREKNAQFHVVKNNFARIAFEELGFPKDVEPILLGPTGVAFSKGEANEVAKVLVDFSKEVPALKVKGGLIEKGFLDAKAIEAFSKLPSKNTLIAMFMGALKSPVQKLVYTLVAYQEKLGASGAGGAPAAAEAAPAEAASSAGDAPAAEAAQA
jgi:large subunit ribosomal protein L10